MNKPKQHDHGCCDRHDHHHPCDHGHDHIHPDRAACESNDQLPSISKVGRGLQGDGYVVRISDPDDCTQTYLEGLKFDAATGEYYSEWISENINGGELSYQYNLRPWQIPTTFTITFIYRRPGRCEWSWTTPAIPYIWDTDGDGLPDVENVIGSGVATLYIRTSKNAEWNERLHYPPGTTGEDYNHPAPEEPWSATITFGYGGDVELPNFDDIAKIIGCTKEDIFNILEGDTFIFEGIEADNLLDYINKCDKRDRDHFHKDLGFPDAMEDGHPDEGAFGGQDNVKDYIDWKIIQEIKNIFVNDDSPLSTLIQELLEKIYGFVSFDPETGEITWNPDVEGMKIPQGSINILSNSRDNAILTHDNPDADCDLKAN